MKTIKLKGAVYRDGIVYWSGWPKYRAFIRNGFKKGWRKGPYGEAIVPFVPNNDSPSTEHNQPETQP